MKSITIFTFIFIINILNINSQIIDSNFLDPIPYRSAKILKIDSTLYGQMLIGGDISFYENHRVNNLIRLNSDNTLDTTFIFNGPDTLIIKDFKRQNNGKLIVWAQDYISSRNYYGYNFYLYQLDQSGNIISTIDTLKNITSIFVQDDNKIIATGYSNDNKGYIIRYNDDFSLDNSFDNQIIFDEIVTFATVNLNSIYVTGMFSTVNNHLKNDIVRLNMNGSIDTLFDSGSGTNSLIGSLTILSNGKILLGKSVISSFNGVNFNGLVRLNNDGSPDQTFFTNENIWASEIYINNLDIYVATPLNINNTNNFYFVKLDSNGNVNQSFTPVILDNFGSFDFSFYLKNNSIFINNTSVNGNKYGVSNYDLNGNLNTNIKLKTARYGVIRSGDVFNNKILIAGDFIKINDYDTYGISLLNSNGSIDTNFLLNESKGAVIQAEIISDSTILVSTGKEFFKVNQFAQIQNDFNFTQFKTLYNVLKFKTLPDGKIIAGDCNNVYRLNSNGSEDTTFNIGTGIDQVSSSYDFDIQSDGKVIFGGIFNNFNGQPVNKLIRINTDGSLDTSFNLGSGPESVNSDDGITLVKVLENQEIIIGGYFNSFNGHYIPTRILKLNSSGQVDSTFISNQLSEFPLYVIDTKEIQVGQKLYIKSSFNIRVINIDGSPNYDLNFNASIINISDLLNITNQPGKALISNDAIFTLGNFVKQGNSHPSFILKLINNESNAGIVEKATQIDYSIYPNPFKDNLTIEIPKNLLKTQFIIYNLDGTIVFNSAFNNLKTTIELNDLKTGIYFISNTSSNGKSQIHKIVKH